MNNETLLKKLIKIRDGNITLLDEVISDLKLDIKSNSIYKATKKTKINAIKKVLDKQKDIRPVLGGYHINNRDMIEFTDSYRAYELNKIELPFKKVVDKKDDNFDSDTMIIGSYPNLDFCFKKINDIESNDYTKIDIDINDILGAFKTKESKDDLYIIDSGKDKIHLNISYLKETIDILGNNIICYGRKGYEPVYFYNEYNETGLVLPIRTY